MIEWPDRYCKQHVTKVTKSDVDLSAVMFPLWHRARVSGDMDASGTARRCLVVVIVVVFFAVSCIEAVSSSGKRDSREIEELRFCQFNDKEKLYNISDLIQCMDELAATAVGRVSGRSKGGSPRFSPGAREGVPYAQFPSYADRPDDDQRFTTYYDPRPGEQAYQGSRYPPALPPGYYNQDETYGEPYDGDFGSFGGPGVGLFKALNSISQYDDYKCVPRVLCEVATGVNPADGRYKQSSSLADLGKSALFGLLTALNIDESSSPVLSFGKAALLGYTNKGNPSSCYQEYPKCPRGSQDLVYYLNNHNGGFFRFFSNDGNGGYPLSQRPYRPQGINGYGLARRVPAPPPGLSGPEAVRTGTGELKFDNPAPATRRDHGKSLFSDERTPKNDTRNFVFPDPRKSNDEQPLRNRVSKSLSRDYGDTDDNFGTDRSQDTSAFFPQESSDQESNALYSSSRGSPPRSVRPSAQRRHQDQDSARVVFPEESPSGSSSIFTFPDGRSVKINPVFSRLFNDYYEKSAPRTGEDATPQPTSFDDYNMVNLAGIFPDDEPPIAHPCDMICHDVAGTAIQFNQIELRAGSLSTLMTPDRPILDLSKPAPCEVMCVDRSGDRRRTSTTLGRVLKPIKEQPSIRRTPTAREGFKSRTRRDNSLRLA